ncbi:zinc finger BED domain-containing protein DAYSLEEPER-like [Heracleum sosnowskyi]|uniref:Zinc finger BED domain-containing protein DAYSLEEPER-like n=1 Tax=Heracleum sosnowskyi TaxID=360622 RepID=A0AAD8M9H1_9APIA|nr:zinc finger BED domain-containing protein DAYSLEEPER-like [Heracleum sosnowskyi]
MATKTNQQPNSFRRKKSIVWDYFTVQQISAGCKKACCNQCKRSFAYVTDSKLAGTSHLKRHIATGICPVIRQKSKGMTKVNLSIPLKTEAQSHTTLPRKRVRSRPVSAPVHEIAKMIMLHEYPLNIVEHSGFNEFLQAIQPQVNMLNIDTVESECFSIYTREKQGILDLLNGSFGRVNLTLDLWESPQSLVYVILTGHFTDSDWKLQRRILNVVMLPFPESESAFNQAVVACINDWGLDNKLFTLTLDKSFATEAVRRNLRGLLPIKNPHTLGGQLLLGNCYARVISHLAVDALSSMVKTIKKVRDIVKYVKTVKSHEEKFIKLKQQLHNTSTKSLIIDDRTKWDTTYHMLVAASEVKEVFPCLDTSDPNYKETPSIEEWRQVEILCSYLKLFFDAANILTSPTYTTADIFFHDVWKIQLELTHAAMSEDTFVRTLAKPLQERFNEYWKDCNLILAAAVVMDPTFKMELVKFSFSKIYGKDADTWVKSVIEGVHELYLDYIPAPTFVVEEDCEDFGIEMTHEDSLIPASDGLSDFDVYLSEIMSCQHMKSELDLYLEEPLWPRAEEDLDLLAWWKENKQKYPTLSRMASDILSIPVSTVASESVFDTETKKMDSYQSSLSPLTVQALICSKDWLKYGPSKI